MAYILATIFAVFAGILWLDLHYQAHAFRNHDYIGLWIGLGVLVIAWARMRRTYYPIVLDSRGVTFKGNTYQLDKIKELGWGGGGGGGTYLIENSLTSMVAPLAFAYGVSMSGFVYIQYGKNRIFLAAGMRPVEAENICTEMHKFLARFAER